MKHVHLEGMGIVGCTLALFLARWKIPFTWNDTNHPITAWKASTACIYPTGEPEELAAYETWSEWFGSRTLPFRKHAESGAYWYCTKSCPHGGSWSASKRLGELRLHPLPTFHLNAQDYVRAVRELFAGAEVQTPPRVGTYIVAHGFNQRLGKYLWGWSADAELEIHDRVLEASDGSRPCFNLRRGRFVQAYAYPKPNEAVHYAGSDLISQTIPKALDVSDKARRWASRMHELSGGLVQPTSLGSAKQGWRPMLPSHSTDFAMFTEKAGKHYVRPLVHSGVRLLPNVVKAFEEIVR